MTNPALAILEAIDRHLRGPGTIRLMGGAAMILAYGRSRATEDADLLLDDREIELLIETADFGEALARANEELEPLGLYVTHIWGPEQQILTPEWRESCRRLELPTLSRLEVEVLGPLDLVASKLCRADDGDLADIRHLVEHEHLSQDVVLAAVERCLVPEAFVEVFPRSRAKLAALLASFLP